MVSQIRLILHNTVTTLPTAYLRHRTCDRKKVYGTVQEGWAAVRHIQRNGNDLYPDFELRTYMCEFCGRIHVGHSNTSKSSEAQQRISTMPHG